MGWNDRVRISTLLPYFYDIKNQSKYHMFKKIVGFGDSWMWGDELINPALLDHPHAHPVLHLNTPYRENSCFLGLLGKHYGVPTENFGIAGGSMQSSIWTYIWWLENEKLDPSECLILVGHTDPNRYTFYNPHHEVMLNDPPWNRFVHSSWIHGGATCHSNNWIDMVKKHIVLTDCPESQILNTKSTVLFFDGQYHALSNNVMQFFAIEWHSCPDRDSMIFKNSSLNNLLPADPEFFAPNRHPNEKGHEVISQELQFVIDKQFQIN
jgi:hypothetical protein